jgi:hypothetical protein
MRKLGISLAMALGLLASLAAETGTPRLGLSITTYKDNAIVSGVLYLNGKIDIGLSCMIDEAFEGFGLGLESHYAAFSYGPSNRYSLSLGPCVWLNGLEPDSGLTFGIDIHPLDSRDLDIPGNASMGFSLLQLSLMTTANFTFWYPRLSIVEIHLLF